MIALKHRSPYLTEGFFLVLASAWCVVILLARMSWAGDGLFLFLVWNLFLAWIPWFISAFAFPHFSWKKPAKWGFAGIWLLFLPNAPYILTDLVHLRTRVEVPFWMDLILIISFALTGLLIGLASLKHVWEDAKMIPRIRVFLFPAICILSAFGVYLGRYLRWNSWEVVSEPFSLISDLMQWVYHPSLLKEPLAFSVGFGIMFWMMFWIPGQIGQTQRIAK